MVFAFAGCAGGGADEGGFDPSFLYGAKVLTRPEEYDFSEAVGENCTENYYNVFSKWILQFLYNTYRKNGLGDTQDENGLSQKDYIFNTHNLDGYVALDRNNGETFVKQAGSNIQVNTGENIYYFYETPRYTILSYLYDSDNTKRVIEISTNHAWKWMSDLDYYDVLQFGATKSGSYTYKIDEAADLERKLSDYYGTISDPGPYDYAKYYYNETEELPEEGSKDFFFNSPYYDQAYNVSGPAPSNLYQDALEYVVYMLVLGKSLTDDELQIAVTSPSNITVGTARTDIKVALGNAKELYKKTGNYVGVTQKNMDDLKTFVLKEVIGVSDANPNGTFETYIDNRTTPTRFNRNYQAVVTNIIQYACTKAPIGEKDGQPIYLSDNYPVATITEYVGDHFSLDFTDFDESDPSAPSRFAMHEAAEYQSIILYPESGDVGKHLLDLGLCFEYYENPSTTKTMADSIAIDVGFRYYNSTTHAIQDIFLFTVNVGYAKNGEQEDTGYPLTEVWACENEDVLADVAPQTAFTSPEAITPTEGDLVKTTMDITSGSPASAYYSVVETDGVQHIVLNENMISCDFMEVYFVVHKDDPNICYAFKVATTIFFEDV